MSVDVEAIASPAQLRWKDLPVAVQVRIRYVLKAELAEYERACHDEMAAGRMGRTTYERRVMGAERFLHYAWEGELAERRPRAGLE
jgi:hypothetical protein